MLWAAYYMSEGITGQYNSTLPSIMFYKLLPAEDASVIKMNYPVPPNQSQLAIGAAMAMNLKKLKGTGRKK